MPASLSGPTQDAWWNAGAKYFRGGVSRGTTTSSGVFAVATGFPRAVFFNIASDESNHTRIQQTGGGPAQTQSTFFLFNMISPNGATARWRVLRQKASSDMNSTFTLASVVTGVTVRWIAFGF